MSETHQERRRDDADARIAEAERDLAIGEARRGTFAVLLLGPVVAAWFWIRRWVVAGDPRPGARVWWCLVATAVALPFAVRYWWRLRTGRAAPRPVALVGSPQGDEWFSLTPDSGPELRVSFDVDGEGFGPVVVLHRGRELATLRQLGIEDEELLLPDCTVLRLRAVKKGWRLRLEVEYEGRTLEPCPPPRRRGA